MDTYDLWDIMDSLSDIMNDLGDVMASAWDVVQAFMDEALPDLSLLAFKPTGSWPQALTGMEWVLAWEIAQPPW